MTSNEVKELTNGEFDVYTKKGLVLIDFFADWCMPCLMMGPVIDELNDKFKGKIRFGKVNIEDYSELAEKFDVRSIPNFVLFKDGKPVENFIGSMPSEDFEERLREFV